MCQARASSRSSASKPDHMADPADEIRAALVEMADPARAPDMQRYMKSQMPYLGVRKTQLTPHVMRMAKGLDRDTMLAVATGLWEGATHREERYAALAVLRAGTMTAEDEPLLRHLVTTGAWWDLVDETATKLVGPLREQMDIRAWAVDDDMWIRRAAIICQVGSRGRGTDAGLLADVI